MNYRDKILELHSAGYSRREIKRKLSCSLHTISTHLPGRINEIGKTIQNLRACGMSLREIQRKLNCSKSTVSKWSSLLPENNNIKNKNVLVRKSIIHRRILEKQECSNIYQWKKDLKNHRRLFIVRLHGAKCCICGYDKSPHILHFHHVNQSTKLFDLSSDRLLYNSMRKILDEMNKCILVCPNHHAEIHLGLIDASVYYKPKDLSNIQVPADLEHYPVSSLDAAAIAREKNWISYKLGLQHRKLQERETNVLDLNKVSIKNIDFSSLNEFLMKYHYLGPTNKGTIRCYGFYIDDVLVGVAQIGNPVRQLRENGICELSRFCLSNSTSNLASKCLGLLLRELRNLPYKKIQTFADSDFHTGAIYKAVGFTPLYTTTASYNYSGIHKKTIYERAALYGLHEMEYAKIFGLERQIEGSKIKFIRDL